MFMDGLLSLRGGTRHLGVRWVKLERETKVTVGLEPGTLDGVSRN
jgi:hypothetical protein